MTRYVSEVDLGQVTLDDIEPLVEETRKYAAPDLDLKAARLRLVFEVGDGDGILDLWNLYEIVNDGLYSAVVSYGGRWLQAKPVPADEGS